MKIKSGFVLHAVGGESIVVPVGERTKDFHGMIRLNASAAFIWQQMTAQGDFTKESLVAALLENYEVTEELAAQTVDTFIATLLDGGIIEA